MQNVAINREKEDASLRSKMRPFLKVSSILALAFVCIGAPVAGLAGEFVEPTNCGISGGGTLENGDFVLGEVDGTAISGFGSWFHELDDGTFFVLSPDTVSCRINGVAIARSQGTVAVGPGFTYTLEVEDYDTGGAEPTQTLSASRDYSASRWNDGEFLLVGGEAAVTIPTEIPVVSGDAGNQWTFLTFSRAIEGDQVTCRYRGNGDGPGAPGDAYEIVRCTGEDDGTADVDSGDLVIVTSLTLHVQSGCGSCGSTEVEVDIQVGDGTDDDFYVLIIEDAAGEVIFDRRGYFVDGGITVEDLD